MLARATIVLCVVSLVLACAVASGDHVHVHSTGHPRHVYDVDSLCLQHGGRPDRGRRQERRKFPRQQRGLPRCSLVECRCRRHRGRHEPPLRNPGCTRGRPEHGHRQQWGRGGLLAQCQRLPFALVLARGQRYGDGPALLTTTVGPYAINNSQQIVGEDGALGLAIDGTAVNSQAVILDPEQRELGGDRPSQS